MFASTGEKLEDFELFHPDRMASRILDMGDVLTLIEQAERAFDADQAQAMAAKLAADEDFTLEDFLAQMAALKNMGSIKKMIGMLPGMGELRDQLDSFDEREMDRIEAIIQSMTPQERRQPRILNGSRRAARGAGRRRPGQRRQPAARAVHRGAEDDAPDAQGRRHAGHAGGMPGLPGMGGGGKKSRGRTAPPGKAKQKGKSGNPAKRAQQEREAAQRRAGAGAGAAVPPAARSGWATRPSRARSTRRASTCPRASRSSSAVEQSDDEP